MVNISGKQRRANGRRAKAGRALATAVFLGAAGTSPVLLSPAFAQSFAFSNVSVEGNERVDASTILSYAGIGRGQQVSAGALNDAYQRINGSGLFETVEIIPQGNTLVIRVKEYPFINVINFEGNKRLKDEDLATMVKSQSRRVFSPSTAEADAAAIAEMYRSRGRIAATVTPRVIKRDGNRVDLVFEITEGKVVEIETLSFVGNRAYSDRRLRQVLQTKQAGLLRAIIQKDTYIAERIDLDKQLLTEFYRSRGYIDFQVLDASAEVSRERDATFVTFTIREGQQYSIGNITTVSEVEGVNAADFADVQKIKTGQTWNPALIDNNIARMENLALRKGLNFVRVEPRVTRDDRNQRVNIEFAVVRGEKVFVERIDIEGNATTLDQVVRRQFRTVEGDPFNPREIRQSAERIRALGFFSDARVNAEPGSAPDQVVVNVDVDEQPTGSLGFGLSYSVASGAGVSVNFSESNFLGRGQAIGFSVSTSSDNQSSSFSFTEPALFGRDLSLSFGLFYRTTDSDHALYNTRNAGFSVALGFPLGDQSRFSLRYRLSRDNIFDLEADEFDNTTVPPTPVDIRSPIIRRETDAGALVSSSIGYSYDYDTRITGLDPTRGFLFRFGQDIGGLGGDTKFLTTTVFAMAEQKVWNEEVTLRAIFEGGHIHDLGDTGTRVTDRFFMRGKMRGFEPNGIGPRDGTDNEDALGGNVFAVARFESEFPLGLPEEYGIMGGAFVDVGSVWSLTDTCGLQCRSGGENVDDGFKPRVAVGVSVLWDTPVGPLRFNFSKAVKKEDYDREQTFDLTVSTKF
ncbi:outer membrane protein assembly factor BamA [Xinfangfangia sp. D13-10-4-6]|uniref:outer membrane protein assembly factor BamA n=1 Tax=Pseudogemmobacter hezensis TaxID=2737662 RepID=UPI00155546CF|nr:outer membrane protein assembly factor BamA [Pseudogemmobacter hezensis]NPD17542.1 outer membrane protein assembly factor BamA [Pseudogemmobacter hezensis]